MIVTDGRTDTQPSHRATIASGSKSETVMHEIVIEFIQCDQRTIELIRICNEFLYNLSFLIR